MQALDRPTLNPIADRMPLSNIDAEIEVLGAILLDPVAIARVASVLPSDAFYISSHRKIYEAALELHMDRRAVDLSTLATALKDAKQLDNIGGKLKLGELLSSVITSANVDAHAALLLDKHHRRCMARLATELQKLSQDTTQSTQNCLSAAQGHYRELLSLTAKKGDVEQLADVMASVYQNLLERAESSDPEGIPTEFYDYDRMSGGIIRGDLSILAGRPSMGKTAAMLGIATQIAEKGHGVVLYSMEMSSRQIGRRLLSSYSGINGHQMRMAKFKDSQWESMGRGLEKVSGLPIWIDDTPNQSVAQMNAKVQQLQAEGHNILLVMVDYLQLMGDGQNRAQELDHISRDLKRMARELDVSVCALSQLSRSVESRTNKRPMMSDLRESGGIEQTADLITMLYREEYYDPETPEKGVCEWIIAKNRNGPTGTVKLLFENELTRFRNLAPQLNG